MYLYVKALTFDCSDSLGLARFWANVLGSDVDEESTSEKAFVEAPAWGGPNMWFNRVPEPKSAKNRIHLDLRTLTSVDEEVARLRGLGASVVSEFTSHTVMRDPEGNEFCVEPSPLQTAMT